jgi:hypothetical protein
MSLESHESAPDIKEIKEQELQAQLAAQLSAFMTDVETIVTDKTGLSVMLNMERTRHLPGRIQMRFLEDAKAVTEEVKDLHRKNPEITHSHLLAEQLIKLDSIKRRVGVFMDVHKGTGKEVSTEAEAIQLARVLEKISLEGIDLLETLYNSGGLELEDKTLDQVAEHLIVCSKPGAEGLGFLVMAYLSHMQRTQVLKYMIGKPEKYQGMSGIITALVANNYIKVDQGQAIFDSVLNPKEEGEEAETTEAKEDLTRKERRAQRQAEKQTDKLIGSHEGEYQQAREFLESKEMKQAQQRAVEVKKEAEHLARTRNFGHKNYAKEVFSLKGIASAFLVANGALTTVGNVVVNLDTGNMLNPYLYAGLLTVAGGLQLSDGFGGMLPTPLEGVGKLSEDKGEKLDAKAQERKEYMHRELGNNPKVAEFYFKYAEQIVTAYSKKRESLPKDKINLTLDDLGLKYTDIEPNKVQSVPQAEIESQITKWVKVMEQNEYGMALKGADAHQKFINDGRKERGLAEFEPLKAKPITTS